MAAVARAGSRPLSPHALARRRQTPQIGLWLDISMQTVTETVEEIFRRYRLSRYSA